MLSSFYVIAIDFDGILHVALGLDDMHSASAFIWTVIKFLYSSFGVCLSNVFWKVSILFLTVNAYSFTATHFIYCLPR